MHHGAGSAHVVSHNAQFSAAFKEQQAFHAPVDHRQSNPRYVGRAGFDTLRRHLSGEYIAGYLSQKPIIAFTFKWPVLIKRASFRADRDRSAASACAVDVGQASERRAR